MRAQGQLVIVMRHGERRDGDPTAVPENDPPLTPSGVKDVVRVADRLRYLLGHDQLKQIQLVTSPFLRTRQTAEALKANGIGGRREMKVDNTLSEVYGPVRIKTGSPHAFDDPEVVRRGTGKLPEWGETLDEAANRFYNSLLSNANAAARSEGWSSSECQPLRQTSVKNSRKGTPKAAPVLDEGYLPLLITHGDALGSIVHRFYPSRIVYRAEYLSFLVLERLSPLSSSFRILHAEDVEWILDGEDITPEEVDLVLHAEEEKEDSQGCQEQHHPKCSEDCENGCPPSVCAQFSQSSVNSRIGQQERGFPERKSFANITPASLRTSTLLCSAFFNTAFLLIQLLTIEIWQCKARDILFGVVAALVLQSMWSAWVLWVFWYRCPLHWSVKRVLIGTSSISSYSPVESPREHPERADAGEHRFDFIRNVVSWVYSDKVMLLLRVGRLTVLKIVVVFLTGCFLCVAMGRDTHYLLCFLSQFTLWRTVIVFLLSLVVLFLASWFDLHILIAVAQV